MSCSAVQKRPNMSVEQHKQIPNQHKTAGRKVKNKCHVRPKLLPKNQKTTAEREKKLLPKQQKNAAEAAKNAVELGSWG